MTTTLDRVRQELLDRTPADPVLAAALAKVWAIVGGLKATAALEELTLCTLDPDSASEGLRASRYFTSSFMALRDEKLIIVNERFLLELEAVIRSFAQAESLLGIPYLKSDASLFDLVSRIEADLVGTLARARRQTARPGREEEEAAIRRELRMVLLFFLGHELGHVLGGHPSGEYATFVDPDLPLEDRIDEAVVKLCRHVDQFNAAELTLPGFQKLANPRSAVRRKANKFRAAEDDRYDREEAFFANESTADDWANRIVVEHLEALAKEDALESDRCLYHFSRGVFAAALFTWYRDLAVFGRKLSLDAIQNASDLVVEMMKSRQQYVHAASLFGEFHRFTFLRAVLGLDNVLHARTRWFDQPVESRRVWTTVTAVQAAGSPELRRQWWLSECIQRAVLLRVAMDTAIKIANVGCSTGWLLDVDRKRDTPQMFIMEYESIGRAVERLRRLV